MDAVAEAQLTWLDSLLSRGASQATIVAYRRELESFRARLQAVGSDLDGEPVMLAYDVELWCGRQLPDRRPPRPTTYNRRLYTLSSFYHHAVARGILSFNPCIKVARAGTGVLGGAIPYI